MKLFLKKKKKSIITIFLCKISIKGGWLKTMTNKQKAIKTMLIQVLLLPAAVVAATIMMILLYSLPTEQMKKNVAMSIPMWDGGSFSFNNWANGKNYTKLSNFTESIMFNTAIYRPTNSAIYNSMITAHAIYSDIEKNIDAGRIAKDEEGFSTKEYSRYWHGYLLYMIPGLQIMDIGELKIISLFLQFFLTLVLVYLLGKRSMLLILFYGTVALFINPVTTVLTFQEADIYCIMMISMIIMLRYNEKLQKGLYFSFFMVNGICVAFFDLLTYPLVAFGVPLILNLLINDFTGIRDELKKIIIYSIGWIIGYVGMWGGKWLVSSILTGRNMFSDAFRSIGIRTHGQGEYNGVLSYRNTLSAIWNSINDLPMILLFLLTIGIIILYFIRNKHKILFSANSLKRSTCFLIIGLFPFLWYYVVMNHSIVHPWYSYRELAITIWSIAAIVYTNSDFQKITCADLAPQQG